MGKLVKLTRNAQFYAILLLVRVYYGCFVLI